MPASITVVIAHELRLLREGARALLEAESDMVVVDDAGDGERAVELAVKHRPRVLAISLILPGLGGFEVMRRASRRSPRTRFVVLSRSSSELLCLEAFHAGALAFISRHGGAPELLRGIRAASSGNRYVAPPLSEEALAAYARRVGRDEVAGYGSLSPRERQVLRLVAEGQSATAIATRLAISARTAETHRANVMRKLGLHGTTEIVRFAMLRGLLSFDEGQALNRKASG